MNFVLILILDMMVIFEQTNQAMLVRMNQWSELVRENKSMVNEENFHRQNYGQPILRMVILILQPLFLQELRFQIHPLDLLVVILKIQNHMM